MVIVIQAIYMKQMFRLITGPLLLTMALMLAGCHTPDPDRASTGQMASLEIPGHSEAEILRAVKDTLVDNGYEHMEGLTFDKRGSGMDTALYGGWDSGGVWIRLKLTVEPAASGNGNYVIGCDAYRVIAHNQGVMEEEKKTRHSNRDECDKMLQAIKARLSGTPAAAN